MSNPWFDHTQQALDNQLEPKGQVALSAWLGNGSGDACRTNVRDLILTDGDLRWSRWSAESIAAARRRCMARLRVKHAALPGFGPLEDRSAFADVRKPTRIRVRVASCLGLAAGLLLVVGFILWNATETMAMEKAFERTGRSLAEAKGVLVRFSMRRDSKNEDGKWERTEHSGLMKTTVPGAQPRGWRCEEKWDDGATNADGTPRASERLSICSGERSWFREQTGDSVFEGGSRSNGNAGPFAAGPIEGDAAEGSPVDPRSGSAVEAVQRLLRDFKNNKVLKWMGYKWVFMGGRGTEKNPFRYRHHPDDQLREQPERVPEGLVSHRSINWRMQAVANPTSGLVERVVLVEEVTDARTKQVFSRTRADYRIQLLKDPWPKETFEIPRSEFPGFEEVFEEEELPDGEGT